ncbi:MAG: phenylalanine--tRNA ligase subunit beta [Nitrospinae bacterium]|nr:phenylalanine--tRNA ligase subunit beta [Nitrospinota bacterium]
MIISVDWLKEYVDLDFPLVELEETLTMGGLEVEGIERVELADGSKTDAMEINVTPNRGYCLSHIGVAREVAALAKRKLSLPDPDAELLRFMGKTPVEDRVSVSVADETLCPRYSAIAVENVTVGPSPKWLADRLTAIGLRPINNIVDITNFVMMEYGQPLHAFDRNLLGDASIVVRRARAKEPFVSLDGAELKLDTETLVIADAEKPVALAGVMGGANSQVTSETKAVVLESAYFDPVTVRKTSKKYGLRTDSSFRFERGVDIEAVITAQSRAALLIKELAGGDICAGRIDIYPNPQKPRAIPLRISRVNQVLGMSLGAEEILGYLKTLGLSVKEDKPGEAYLLEAPSYRPTLAREIDLIEEVARLHGYKNMTALRPRATVSAALLTPMQKTVSEIREILCHAGYSEAVNYSFIEDDLAREFKTVYGDDATEVIPLSNPISSDMGTMRTSLVPGLLKAAARNLNKGQKPVKIFEIGKVFFRGSDVNNHVEKVSLAALAVGQYEYDVWKDPAKGYDFYDLKGTLESLLSQFKLSGIYEYCEKPFLMPGQAALCRIGEKSIGFLGALATPVLRKLDIDKPAYVFELDLDALVESLPGTARFSPIPKFPETFRDISILVDKSVPSQRVSDLIREVSGPLVSRVELFDQFEGNKLEKGKKSLTLALAFRSPERTLTDEEINPLFEKVVQTLKEKLGATLRE